MFLEICLGAIAVSFLILLIALITVFLQTRKSLLALQKDIHHLSTETVALLSSVNAFVRSDLHHIGEETTHLLNQFGGSEDKNKSNLFHFLSSKLGSSSDSKKVAAIPQVIRWIASSISLFKTTKRFIHEK